MSKIIWTAETGWTDEGSACSVRLDEQNRIHIAADPQDELEGEENK